LKPLTHLRPGANIHYLRCSRQHGGLTASGNGSLLGSAWQRFDGVPCELSKFAPREVRVPGCLLHRDDVDRRTASRGGRVANDIRDQQLRPAIGPGKPGATPPRRRVLPKPAMASCMQGPACTPWLFRAHSGAGVAFCIPKRASPVARSPAPAGPCRSWLRCPRPAVAIKNASDVIVTTSASPSITKHRQSGFRGRLGTQSPASAAVSLRAGVFDSQRHIFLSTYSIYYATLVFHLVFSLSMTLHHHGALFREKSDWGPNQTELGVVTSCFLPGFIFLTSVMMTPVRV
jgi:hypothetical protein